MLHTRTTSLTLLMSTNGNFNVSTAFLYMQYLLFFCA